MKNTIDKFIDVGISLSSGKNINHILEDVLAVAIEVSNSDAGTIYLANNNQLNFVVLQNNTLNLKIGGSSDESIKLDPIPLEETNVSAYAAINKIAVNIDDVYKSDLYDFSGPKIFDKKHGYRTKSALVIPMENHKQQVIGVLQLLNAKNLKTEEIISFSKQVEKTICSLAAQAAIALTNNQLIKNLENNIKKVQSLQQSEKELNKQLSNAAREVDQKNIKLQEAIKKIKVIRYYAFAFLLLLGAGGWFYMGGLTSLPGGITNFISTSTVEEEIDITQSTATVSKGPVSASVTMVGKLQPLNKINVASSIEGIVNDVNFQYGGNVEKKQLLVGINASKLELAIADAKVEHLKATEELKILTDWEKSLEVTRANRELNNAKLAIEKAERQLSHSESLFKLEIISKNDFDSAKETVFTAKQAYQTAKEQADIILEKANDINILIAKNKLEKASANLESLEVLLNKKVITAPLSGVIMDPESSTQNLQQKLHVGKETKPGELLLTIGDLSGFSINSNVDEVDVGKIKKGQNVIVTGDAFPDISLKGKVSRISSQAGKNGGFGSVPTFDLVVTVKNINKKVRKKLLVGMSATLEIIIYQNNDALLLPVEAVQMIGNDRAIVRMKKEGQLNSEEVEIKVGRTTFDSVEILQGLSEGETVIY